jgi:hypothetical protein
MQTYHVNVVREVPVYQWGTIAVEAEDADAAERTVALQSDQWISAHVEQSDDTDCGPREWEVHEIRPCLLPKCFFTVFNFTVVKQED